MSTPPSPSIAEPLYGASFGQAIVRFFRKYATFSGRASRSEYWWWQLATTLVYLVLAALALGIGFATGGLNAEGDVFYLSPAFNIGIALAAGWAVVTLIPQIAIAVRRLHDVNLSGWLVLLRLLPSVGDVILLVLTVLPPNPAGARFDKR
ncbi:DUF805 domain-containing protein [Microbacterium sp. BK668]|uniref:DUF805 domain-containing protein n=1 Tax=Microbacterium sp. BK668 TaxID=2512118 RepID=UPI001060033F|nr:DUF805 domain-containing protein [Microbacterium sp. BK668]TDN87285.1 uncharacterized membrane protein YhaH (DUF805 family) [Microbacterium sp. BK668]